MPRPSARSSWSASPTATMDEHGLTLAALSDLGGFTPLSPRSPMERRLGPFEGLDLWHLAGPWAPGCPAPVTLIGRAQRSVLDALRAHWRAAPPRLTVFCEGAAPPAWWDPAWPALATDEDLASAWSRLAALRPRLARWRSVHGTLVAVHGRGLLITGEAGVGKSELALQLVERGHALVADDLVQVAALAPGRPWGRPVAGAEGRLHLRDLGEVDLVQAHGRRASAAVQPIHAVVRLQGHRAAEARLAPARERETLAGVPLPVYPMQARAACAALVEWVAVQTEGDPCVC